MHHANQNPSAEVTSQGWLVCFMGEPVLKHLPKAIATVRRGMLLSEALLCKNFSNKRRVDGRVLRAAQQLGLLSVPPSTILSFLCQNEEFRESLVQLN